MSDRRPIFVFGSNRQGRHGKGVALCALRVWGAIYGIAEGLRGKSYAIVTKELRKDWPRVTLTEVRTGVRRFLGFARRAEENDCHLYFLVQPIGCGLAGFTPLEIAPMFRNAPKNVDLPEEFKRVLAL